ncbi:MAG: hypothetical protein QGH72_01560, partial [Dehalococcoidia bacterium]|nr:hypothetical protein [Dehalococcoidia bacterium]
LLTAAGISMDQVTATLLTEGVASFADSFDKLMTNIEEKQARLLAREHAHNMFEQDPNLSDKEHKALAAELRRLYGEGGEWS